MRIIMKRAVSAAIALITLGSTLIASAFEYTDFGYYPREYRSDKLQCKLVCSRKIYRLQKACRFF